MLVQMAGWLINSGFIDGKISWTHNAFDWLIKTGLSGPVPVEAKTALFCGTFGEVALTGDLKGNSVFGTIWLMFSVTVSSTTKPGSSDGSTSSGSSEYLHLLGLP